MEAQSSMAHAPIADGTYYPNELGARTVRDARPLYVGTERVSVVVGGGTVSAFIGLRLVAEASASTFLYGPAQLYSWARGIARLDHALSTPRGVSLVKATDLPSGVVMAPSEWELDRRRSERGLNVNEAFSEWTIAGLARNDLTMLLRAFAVLATGGVPVRLTGSDGSWVTYESRCVVEDWRRSAIRAGGYEMACAWGQVLRGEV